MEVVPLDLDVALRDAESALQSITDLTQSVQTLIGTVRIDEIESLVLALKTALTGRDYDAAYTSMLSKIKSLHEDFAGSWYWDKLSGIVTFYNEAREPIRSVSVVDTPEVTEYLNEQPT